MQPAASCPAFSTRLASCAACPFVSSPSRPCPPARPCPNTRFLHIVTPRVLVPSPTADSDPAGPGSPAVCAGMEHMTSGGPHSTDASDSMSLRTPKKGKCLLKSVKSNKGVGIRGGPSIPALSPQSEGGKAQAFLPGCPQILASPEQKSVEMYIYFNAPSLQIKIVLHQ